MCINRTDRSALTYIAFVVEYKQRGVNKMSKKKAIISIIIKIIAAVFAAVGIVGSYNAKKFMGSGSTFLYFTIQSNIWIAVVLLFLAGVMIAGLIRNKDLIKPWMTVLQLVFTVSITLTGIVFCFVLLPTMGPDALSVHTVFLHVVVPVLSVIDFIVFSKGTVLSYKKSFYTAIPPLYYFCFATYGYYHGFNFGHGHNYPYFFLNYGSPAGVFGFSNVMPYFMGSFYWILVATAFVLGVACLYIKLIRPKKKKD